MLVKQSAENVIHDVNVVLDMDFMSKSVKSALFISEANNAKMNVRTIIMLTRNSVNASLAMMNALDVLDQAQTIACNAVS